MSRFARLLLTIVGCAAVVVCTSGAAFAATECNTTMSGAITGGVVVNAGDFCTLNQATVSGGVRISAGGILIVCGSTINGGVSANGAAEIVFGAEEINCDGDVVNGAIHISNTGPGTFPPPAPSIALERSVLNGSVHLTGNRGTISVATNTIAGGLFCSGNASDLIDEGSPSIVTGPIRCKFAEEE